MSDDFGNASISDIFSQYDPLEAGDIGNIDLYGQDIGSLYPDIMANLSQLDLQNLLGDTDLLAAFAKFDPESAALLKAGNLTSTGTSALTGEGLLADAAADKISSELGGDTTKLSNLTQSPSDVALVNPDDINKNVKVVDKRNPLQRLLSGDASGTDLAKFAAMMGIAKLARDDAEKARKEARGASFKASAPVTATRTAYKGTKYAAQGGLMGLAEGGVTNPLDYTPSFSDVSGTGLGSGFADPRMQEMLDKLDLRAVAQRTPELDTLSNQLSQQEDAIKNKFLAQNVSIDQITGDIDPIQTLRNVRAYDPSTFDTTVNSLSDVPGRINTESLGNLKSGIKDLGNLGLPYDDLMDVVQSIAEIRANPDLVGNLSNLAGDIRSVVKPSDEEELGSNYTGLISLQAPKMGEDVTQMRAAGGLASLAEGGKTSLPPRYLDGHTDGMADNVPAHIDRKRPAALSDGEFVIPADVVSHLGNGNSNAGAKRLYEMMDRIRSARTGNSKQGKQINPNRFLPR